MHSRCFIISALLLLSLSSCTWFSTFLHDDEVVARLGDKKLYKSEIEAFIPDNASPKDSASYAERYINAWATDLTYMKVAQKQLSKQEMDVTAELESYRISLIKYRYEQRYISDRLDTLVTDAQIKSYYDTHKDDFVLSRPLLKVRFVHIMKDSPSRDRILKMMSSDEYDVIRRADTLARSTALRYFDNSDMWMDAGELAKEFDVDYKTMISGLKDNMIRIEHPDRGDLMAAYVCDMVGNGVAPVEYCSPEIRDIILSNRKYEILMSLEQDLLSSAQKNLVLETE